MTMAHSFGDVVLVPFPFTDQSGAKKRPAVIVSSSGYNANRRDLNRRSADAARGNRADHRINHV